MIFPRLPLSDLFLTEVNNTGALLMTQYVGLTYLCGSILLYDISTKSTNHVKQN